MSKTIPRVFIDTNVWFSAFYRSENPENLLKAHVEGKIVAIASQKVLNELIKNFKNKYPKALKPLKNFLKTYPPVIIVDPNHISHEIVDLVDKKDRKIFQSAINSKAKIFVTGNLKHFKIQEIYTKYKIEVIPPREAVMILLDN